MIKIVTKARYNERIPIYIIVGGKIEKRTEDYDDLDIDELFDRLDKKYDLYFIDKHDARQYLKGV